MKKIQEKPLLDNLTLDLFKLNNYINISLGGESLSSDVLRDLKEFIVRKHPDWRIIKETFVTGIKKPVRCIISIGGYTPRELYQGFPLKDKMKTAGVQIFYFLCDENGSCKRDRDMVIRWNFNDGFYRID